jgi:transcriptional regulator with XRE-family HTH domain
MTRSLRAAGFEAHDVVARRFGHAVRHLRVQRGWSQEALAARAELNRSYMGEIERADVMPSLATADKLARALGLPLSHLIAHSEPLRAVVEVAVEAPLPSMAG